jgi:hypothetical protein
MSDSAAIVTEVTTVLTGIAFVTTALRVLRALANRQPRRAGISSDAGSCASDSAAERLRWAANAPPVGFDLNNADLVVDGAPIGPAPSRQSRREAPAAPAAQTVRSGVV